MSSLVIIFVLMLLYIRDFKKAFEPVTVKLSLEGRSEHRDRFGGF